MADPDLSSTFLRPTFSRPTWAEINLGALQQNAHLLSASHGASTPQSTPLIAVIKANAYGHGAIEAARALLELDFVQMLAVASVDEARALREAKVSAPILLLSAILPSEAVSAVTLDLTATLSTPDVAKSLDQAAKKQKKVARAHWKIDTGMNRVGTAYDEAGELWRALREYSDIYIEGIYTHFANADDARDEMTPRQLAAFENALDECELDKTKYCIHAANSAAVLRYPAARFDAIRPGIALYGASPFGVQPIVSVKLEPVPLKPVMSLKARITQIRKARRGQSVSYGATWTASRDSALALVPIGYADGYARALSNKGEVLLRGQRCRVAGRVTMDQILVDVSAISPNAQVSEIVTAWGEDENGVFLPVEEVAAKADTIAYELLCRVASRVPRVYLN